MLPHKTAYVPAESHDAILNYDADVRGFYAWFPLEFGKDIFLELLVGHALVV